MQILKERIETEGRHIGNGIIKVDSFMNHQLDPVLLQAIGEEFARRFSHTNPTRILTAETSGIAPALATAMVLKIPMVFARKKQPITMKDPFMESASSPTKGGIVSLMVSPEYLSASDRVLIIDDFLASAQTLIALAKVTKQSGATLVGIGAVIEKSYGNGRAMLQELSVPIESLAIIERYEGDSVIVARSEQGART